MLYVRRSDGAYVLFEGMTADTITGMLASQGLTCEFLTKEIYDAAIAAWEVI